MKKEFLFKKGFKTKEQQDEFGKNIIRIIDTRDILVNEINSCAKTIEGKDAKDGSTSKEDIIRVYDKAYDFLDSLNKYMFERQPFPTLTKEEGKYWFYKKYIPVFVFAKMSETKKQSIEQKKKDIAAIFQSNTFEEFVNNIVDKIKALIISYYTTVLIPYKTNMQATISTARNSIFLKLINFISKSPILSDQEKIWHIHEILTPWDKDKINKNNK